MAARLAQGSDCAGHVDGVTWRANLVAHDSDWLSLTGQAQHRLDEISPFASASPDAVEAAGPDDEMPRTEAADEVLAGELASAVNAQGTGSVVFAVRLTPMLVEPEDIVRADVQERA